MSFQIELHDVKLLHKAQSVTHTDTCSSWHLWHPSHRQELKRCNSKSYTLCPFLITSAAKPAKNCTCLHC